MLKLHLVNMFSPLGKLAGRAIYFACINFFFSLFFTKSKAISVSTGPIFTIFSPNGRYLREFSWSSPVFPIPQGTLPWQPIFVSLAKHKPHAIFAIFTPHESVLGADYRSEFFFNISATLRWQPIKVKNWHFFTDQSTLSCCHSGTDCNIAIPISKD